MMNVAPFFIKRMRLNEFSKSEKEKILCLIFSYLLGRTSYSKVFTKLKNYGVHNDFSVSIRELTAKYIKYIMINLRDHAQKLGSWILPTGLNGIGKSDYKWLRRLFQNIDYEKIKLVEKFPSEEDVIKSYKPKILNLANLIHTSFKNDRAIEVDDLINELNYKLIQAYRLYIFNLGTRNFNENVFYSCLHKALQTRKLDYTAGVFKDKRMVNMVTSSINEDTEDSVEMNMIYYGSPEDILIAKQEFNRLKNEISIN